MTNKKEILLTPEGFLELETEVNDLKLNKRPEVIAALKAAREQGDLSENADYDAARNAQAELESRIKELDFMIENAKIVEPAKKGYVGIGNSIIIRYIDDDETEEYKLVSSLEADPIANKISNESPIGKAIFGQKEGTTVSVESPNGSYQVLIEKIV